MFDRFTDRARKVLKLARQEAERLNHDYIGTEHLLLGLAAEGSGVASNALYSLGADLMSVRIAVERIVSPGLARSTKEQYPFTPQAKSAIDCALEEASSLQQDYVGTEHLLLGLLRVEGGVTAEVFRFLQLKNDDIRHEVLTFLGVTTAQTAEVPTSASIFTGKWRPNTFSDRAHQALSHARDEALQLNYDFIGTEHLLLGLAAEAGGTAAAVLESLGVTPDRIRAEIRRPSPHLPPPESPHLPFTPEAALAIQWAMRESQLASSQQVGTGHMLLGLLHGGENVMSSDILTKMGATSDLVRRRVMERLSGKTEA